jgi:putative (di)nucleoside polyphosphate hydrolase
VSLPYRRGVGIALINRAGKVFVAERLDTPGAWQMPQGGIDAGERPRAAAKRELMEEIGTAKAKIIAESAGWLRYDLPADIQGKVWRGRYRGQEQKWYLMLFTGADSDIDLNAHHAEFARWKWMSFRQLPRVIVGFKRKIYRQVVAEFGQAVAELASPQKKSRRVSK